MAWLSGSQGELIQFAGRFAASNLIGHPIYRVSRPKLLSEYPHEVFDGLRGLALDSQVEAYIVASSFLLSNSHLFKINSEEGFFVDFK